MLGSFVQRVFDQIQILQFLELIVLNVFGNDLWKHRLRTASKIPFRSLVFL